MIGRGSTTLDENALQVCCGDRCARLTRSEAKLLSVLMRLSRGAAYDHLLDVIWEGRADGPAPEIVKVHVYRIRRSLRAIQSDLAIKTVWGVGYVIESPAPPAIVCTFSQTETDALRKCLGIARKSEPDLVAIVEAELPQ